MTIFEFLVAFAAILAGLGAARLLHALPYVFSKDKSFWFRIPLGLVHHVNDTHGGQRTGKMVELLPY